MNSRSPNPGPSPEPRAAQRGHALPDLLIPGLTLIVCGTAAGTASAAVGAYYAGRGNKFWSMLETIGLTPRRLQPGEFRDLLKLGIGLTDIAKLTSGPDSTLRHTDFDAADLERRVLAAAPRILAFNGKKAAAKFLGRRTTRVRYGAIPERIGQAVLYVLPSTSGLAAKHWDERPWREMAEAVRALRS